LIGLLLITVLYSSVISESRCFRYPLFAAAMVFLAYFTMPISHKKLTVGSNTPQTTANMLTSKSLISSLTLLSFLGL
jgi:hypothetical protein